MNEYDEECLQVFLEKQLQLFQEEVATTPEEAEEFLSDCMAVICKDLKDVKDYFDEEGVDISGLSLSYVSDTGGSRSFFLFRSSVPLNLFYALITHMHKRFRKVLLL